MKVVLLITQTSLLRSKFNVDGVICRKKSFLSCNVGRLNPESATCWTCLCVVKHPGEGGQSLWNALVSSVLDFPEPQIGLKGTISRSGICVHEGRGAARGKLASILKNKKDSLIFPKYGWRGLSLCVSMGNFHPLLSEGAEAPSRRIKARSDFSQSWVFVGSVHSLVMWLRPVANKRFLP